MPEHIKIILPPEPQLSPSALLRLQGEMGTPISTIQSKITAGEPIFDRIPPAHTQDSFFKAAISLVHTLDGIGLEYHAWLNDSPVTPQHLRSVLTHKLHVLQTLRGPKGPRSRPLLEDD